MRSHTMMSVRSMPNGGVVMMVVMGATTPFARVVAIEASPVGFGKRDYRFALADSLTAITLSSYPGSMHVLIEGA